MKNLCASIISISAIFLIIFFLMFAGCSEHATPKPYVTPNNVGIQLREDIVFLTATELAQKIRPGELTSLEVLDAFLNQIFKYNPELNAVITVNDKNTRDRDGGMLVC